MNILACFVVIKAEVATRALLTYCSSHRLHISLALCDSAADKRQQRTNSLTTVQLQSSAQAATGPLPKTGE